MTEGPWQELPKELLAQLDRSSEQHMIVPCDPADPVDEHVDLLYQRLDERARIRRKCGEKRADRGARRLPVGTRIAHNRGLALATALVEDPHLDLDVPADAQDGVGVLGEKPGLLILVKTVKGAVLGDFLAETIRYMVPGEVHGLGDPIAGPGTAFVCGVNCFWSIADRPRPPDSLSLFARTSVIRYP